MAQYFSENAADFSSTARASGVHSLADWMLAKQNNQERCSRPGFPSSYPSLFVNGSSVPSANHDIGTRFGRKLRELRRNHRMTQLDLAVMLGIDRSYISEVECGKKGISLATLEVIAIGFRLPVSDLLKDI